jgi:NOL1/NOP2/fmu family ribosome biogenesis protein
MLKFISSKQKKEITKKLESQYQIKELKINYRFLKDTKDKIYIINNKISEIELKNYKIGTIGLYFGTLNNNDLRLSMEGSFLIGKYAKQNILELTNAQLKEWISGKNISTKEELSGFVILKHNKDFLGTGKYKEHIIINHVPKERRTNL